MTVPRLVDRSGHAWPPAQRAHARPAQPTNAPPTRSIKAWPRRCRATASAAAVGAGALLLGACGGGGTHFADNPRPPIPVDLSVYIDNSHVSISPSQVGAGPVILYVTNQATHPRALAIKTSSGRAVASSGEINSGQTAQISTELNQPGSYDLAAGGQIPSTRLRVGRPRPNADNALLQP